MRIRGTKPEFWKSRRIASVSWEARLVLKGLESYVDDNGVGVDDIELIVTDIFPRDMFANGSETVARVSEAISHLHQAGLIWRYEADGDNLLYISFWEDIQRIDKPGKGRKPRPDGTFDYKSSTIRESVASPPVTLAPVTGEQGNRGTEEQGNRGTVTPVGGEPSSQPKKAASELEQHINDVTKDAYAAIGKSANFMGLRGIAKWCITDRGLSGQEFRDACVLLYEMGKPLTRQTFGQLLDGHIAKQPTNGRKLTNAEIAMQELGGDDSGFSRNQIAAR